jgi:SPOR domain
MRKLFWILLLANVALFAAMQKGWQGLGEQASQTQPALNEEMIRLLDVPQSVPTAAVSVQASEPVSAPAATKPNNLVCLEWGSFTGLDLTKAIAALSALQLGDKLNQYQVERDTGYWVYIPPLKNKAAINQKISELKARGITEYFVVQNADQWKNAISLGVFMTQDAALHFLEELRGKRVRSAQVGQRVSKFKVTVFRLSEVGMITEVKMASLQKDFAGSELKRVPCTLTR